MIKRTLITKHYYISYSLFVPLDNTTEGNHVSHVLQLYAFERSPSTLLFGTKRVKSSIAFLREQTVALYVYHMYCVLAIRGVLIHRKHARKDELYCYASRVGNMDS